MNAVAVIIGGAVGAILRYWLSELPYRYLGPYFPYGTLLVNMLGAFVIGFLWGISEIITIRPFARSMIFIGMIGSFTTFSTFMLETFNLLREGEFQYALLNFLVSNFLGLAFVFLGYLLSVAFLAAWR